MGKKATSREGDFDLIIDRLGVLIAILLETGERKGKPIPIGERVAILTQAGMRPAEISRILGKSLSYVTKELVLLRRRKRRGG